MPFERHPPDVPALIQLLAEHGVTYVIGGSTAAQLHGVSLTPGDLDIVPALDPENLGRLRGALLAIDAHPDPTAPFGSWQTDANGEHRWVAHEPRPDEREARRTWRPDPADPSSFDALLDSRLGAIDVVPEISGRFDELAPRATPMTAFGQDVLVASIADLLAVLTVPRREKDRPRVHALRTLQR